MKFSDSLVLLGLAFLTGCAGGIDRTTFSVSLPDKWAEDKKNGQYEAKSFVFFEGPENMFFFVKVRRKSDGASVEALVNSQKEESSRQFADPAAAEITKWAGFEGKGLRIEGKTLGPVDARAVIFGFEKGDNVYLVEEYASLQAYDRYRDDFEKIRQTFKAKTGKEQ
jgi:hypothetical protein